MSIANEITRLQNAKASIKTAINSKGGNLTNELINQYANAIDNIATAKEEETKTVINPDFSLGDIEVTPTTGKVMTKVMVNKDVTNHKAENIKKDITLYGIKGTHEGGGFPLEQFMTFGTDYDGRYNGPNYFRLLTFFSKTPNWHTDADIKIYYKDIDEQEILLVTKTMRYDSFSFIVIPRSYGLLKIVMSLVPDDYYAWESFSGFYAKSADPHVTIQLTPPSFQEDFVLSYVDFDVFHVAFVSAGD